MLTLLLTSMLTLAFNIQMVDAVEVGVLDISVSDHPDPFNPLYEQNTITITNEGTIPCAKVTLSIERIDRNWQWENVTPSTSVQAIWDGRDGAGSIVNPGTYNYTAIAYGSFQETETGTITVVLGESIWPIKLPKTAQTTVYAMGDDGDLQMGVAWPQPRFIDKRDGTITDNLTGLMWTKNANPLGATTTWQGALDYVKGMNAGTYLNFGYTDWRLPNINEIESLMSFENDSDFGLPSEHPFTNLQWGYWSSTSDALYPEYAWVGIGGDVLSRFKTTKYYVWPVRSEGNGTIQIPRTGQNLCYDVNGNTISCLGTGQDGELKKGVEWPNPRFIDNGDCTITDKLTDLMWTKNANIPYGYETWQQALDYISGMNNGSNPNYGRNDWRLPNTIELRSLIDYQEYNPALPPGHPFINIQSDYSSDHYAHYNYVFYWTSTSESNIWAWIGGMGTGMRYCGVTKDDRYQYLWPVRGPVSVTPPENQPPTCVIKLQKDGIEISEIDVGQFFDIYVGRSSDDTGIRQVRFSSDDAQDGIPTGEWTQWLDWGSSLGDWNATTKIKRWAFSTAGYKEVWAEVKDDVGQTDRHCSTIFVHPGYAIIVAGQGEWWEPGDKHAIDHAANNAYRVLRNLGFNDDHIFYLNSKRPQDVDGDGNDEVDAPALIDNFTKAIWEVKRKIGDNPVPPLILYLVGHGSRGKDDPDLYFFEFVPGGEGNEGPLPSNTLDIMLSGFPKETRMLIVIGSCYSGGFITTNEGSISASNRIIITMAHNDQKVGYPKIVRCSDRFWGNLNKGLNVKDAFVTNALPLLDSWFLWLDDNGDKKGHPPNDLQDDGELAASTKIGIPGTENLALTPWQFIWKRSPGELRVYDSQNRVTGLVNGEVKEEIPNSMYDKVDEIVAIFSPSDTYRYEVVGTGEGTYGLEVSFIEEGEAITFTATNIPTSANVVHQYTIDWDALALGEEGVTILVDSDGDGVFEHTFSSDSELTHDEFVLQTETTIDFDPDTLNLKSKGEWVTAYIEFPEGYDVADINVSSILLNTTVPVDPNAPTAIGDYDGDGVPDLMVKFDRAEVINYITANVNMTELYEKGFMTITLTINGYLNDGTPFQGSTTIKIIAPMPRGLQIGLFRIFPQ